MFLIRFPDGPNVQASTAAGALTLLRRGGCRLVAGDRAALLALDVEEQEALRRALRPEGEGHGPPADAPEGPA